MYRPRLPSLEGDELLGRDLVSGKRERHDEALPAQRKEELPSIGMIVGAPDERALPPCGGTAARRFFRPVAPPEKIAVADRVVARVQGLALPPELEDSLG